MTNLDPSLARRAAILATLAGGPVSLAQLGQRFDKPWQDIHRDITTLWTVDVRDAAMEFSPFDFDFYDDEVGPDTLVELRSGGEYPVSQPRLTLAEVVSVLGVLDQLLRAADAQDLDALLALRQRISDAATNAGYGGCLWPPPQRIASNGVADTLNTAIHGRRWVRITYWKNISGELVSEQVRIAPVSLMTGANPLVIAANTDKELRRYRLDRITRVELDEGTYFKKMAREIMNEFASDPGEFTGVDVVLTCWPQARWVSEYIPGAVVENIDGYSVISLTARSTEWLRTLLIRLGDLVVRIEPTSIAQEISRSLTDLKQERP